MKKRYLKILQKIPIYSNHEVKAKKIGTLSPQQIVPFNREKRRDGCNWMEIYLENNKVAYIKKETNTFYKCDNVLLDDEYAKGVSFTLKEESLIPINQLFYPKGYLNASENNMGTIKLESLESSEEKKSVSITLEYLKDIVEVNSIIFKKKEQFYITNRTYDKNDVFIEVDNFKGKKGFLLKKTNTSNLGDQWINYLAITISILTILGIFLGFLANGWIVVSGLMVLAGLVVAVVLIFVLQILLLILNGIFNQIRKRF